jgi:hypothetical protein
METADLAILISSCSAVVAAISLGWNVYRDVVLKPKVVVKFYVGDVFVDGYDNLPTYLILEATNHGPGNINLSMIRMKNSSIWKTLTKSIVNGVTFPDINPLGDQLPAKLEVGDKIQMLFEYNEACLLKSKMNHIGIGDSFGRVHWAPKKDMAIAQQRYNKDFVTN